MSPTTKSKSAAKFPKVVGPDGSPPTFTCGNHHPGHTAKSIKKMMQLYKEGCRRFQVTVTGQQEVLAGPG